MVTVALRSRFGKCLSFLAFALLGLALAAPVALAEDIKAFSDSQLIDGFHKTVFGLEYGGARYGRIVKKFEGPVRLKVVNLAADDRRGEIAAFVRRLPTMVRGLDIKMVGPQAKANFTVYVVDRPAYKATVMAGVLGTHSGTVPGQCLVKVDPGAAGIRASTAVIVSDEGDSLFHRCMVEEILQGLGPMNDNTSLAYSVFNDRSQHDRFMPFDRAIVSMLYDPRVKSGMDMSDVKALLPSVVADIRRNIR